MSNVAPLIDDEAHKETLRDELKRRFGDQYGRRLRRVGDLLRNYFGNDEWLAEDDGTGHAIGDNLDFLTACDDICGGGREFASTPHPSWRTDEEIFGVLSLRLHEHPAIISVLTRQMLAKQQPSLAPA